MTNNYDLRIRLIKFASDCIDVAENLPGSYAGIHIGSQLIRSASSPALHYGEAQAAESPSDFIHKMKVCLKELRETSNATVLIQFRKWIDNAILSPLIIENNELISIFVASLNTVQKNRKAASSK